jgi:hypothetical protein
MVTSKALALLVSAGFDQAMEPSRAVLKKAAALWVKSLPVFMVAPFCAR